MKEFDKDQLFGQYVVFAIEKQLCALSIKEVVEIIRIQPITEVVNDRDYINGVINLRGSIIPVVQLRMRYKLPIVPFNKKTRIIIIRNEDEGIGLIVDEVLMVTHIEDEQLEPPLEMFNTIEKDCFKGFAKVNDQLVGILNLQKVLYPEEVKEG
ncbi:chemotaxis protein CheW [Lysinibacillus endophyticus]|uniref:Chemotaxis protein CheW n=1 Tax=Ureibacillus endophyticus TaxID=1978490 RepID=A0A494Z2K9_9BACL|nr:chemotaxis protein CheW [Lysinibacillus endophyticus]MCP1145767.1 chemotaxis protein CheW [Lysinibacillus endophyticus]RKQ16759.1 chemotaxis protein CheW [Lysinibacillus endophyticus]